MTYAFYMYSWTGDKALRELEEANISKQCFPILLECATKVSHLFGICIILLFLCQHAIYLLDNLFKAIKVATDSETDTANKCHVSDNFGRSGVIVFMCDQALNICYDQ